MYDVSYGLSFSLFAHAFREMWFVSLYVSHLLVDDARLLLGVHYHGFGNWEKIRLDERLGLTKKIAPVELQTHETFLPRAPNLKDRASALLEMVCALAFRRKFCYVSLF